MGKKKPKLVSAEEWAIISEKNWTPVELIGNGLPESLKQIPSDQRLRVFASGCVLTSVESVPDGSLIGGVDVFRLAKTHPEPVDYNKDHYAVKKSTMGEPILLLYNENDNEHWIENIPDRLNNVEVISTIEVKTKNE